MGALGGRIGSLREARSSSDYEAAVSRNIFHDAPPSAEAVGFVAARLQRLAAAVGALPLGELLAGAAPAP
jgi:hypothetical protein